MNSFASQNIWIIGASSGIGEACARQLSAQGARLILSARRHEALEAMNQSLGGQHLVLPLDVADLSACQYAVATLQQQDILLHRLIFLAAIYEPMQLDRLDMPSVQQHLMVNIGGAFNIIHTSLPFLKQTALSHPTIKPQMAFCASVAGYRGLWGAQPYGATKAALINLIDTLKLEAPNLDVRLINPGFVETPLTDKNHFYMPMKISAEEAGARLMQGLMSSCYEIHFPKNFTFILKILRLLPHTWFFYIAKNFFSK